MRAVLFHVLNEWTGVHTPHDPYCVPRKANIRYVALGRTVPHAPSAGTRACMHACMHTTTAQCTPRLPLRFAAVHSPFLHTRTPPSARTADHRMLPPLHCPCLRRAMAGQAARWAGGEEAARGCSMLAGHPCGHAGHAHALRLPAACLHVVRLRLVAYGEPARNAYGLCGGAYMPARPTSELFRASA